MTAEQLPSFIAILIPQVLALLIKDKNISENEAITMLYNSELYAALEKEETKLWHLSALTLYRLLDEEVTAGFITYPEEQ